MSPSALGIVASARVAPAGPSGPAYDAAVMADNPAAFWKFEETSGTSAADSTANSRHMTYAAAVVLNQPGIYLDSPRSVQGGGTGAGAASIAHASGWMSTTAFTVGGWITPTNTVDIAGLFGQNGTHAWIVWQRRGKIGIVTQTSTQQESDGTPILLNKPTHVVARLSSGVVDLFINGVKKATITLATAFSANFGNSPPLEVGRYNGGQYTNAKFDGFAYFNTALSDARIAAHYAAGAPTRDLTVKAFWKLDETSGTNMADSSGNGRNGTYSGAILNQTSLRGPGTAVKGGTSGQGVASVPAAAGSVFDVGEFTIIFDVNAANTTSSKGWITRWSSIGWLIWQSGGKISFYQEWAVGAAQQFDGPTLSVGTAKRVAVVVTTNLVKMYVNGVLTHTFTPTTPIPSTALPIQIGGYNGGNYSEATFDNIKFLDVALTDDEVRMEGTASVYGVSNANLQLWLKADSIAGLSDGAGIGTWLDDSGYLNDGTTGIFLPTYKTGIVNGKPVARFFGNERLNSAAPVGAATQTVVAVVKSTNLAGVNTIRGGGNGTGGLQFRIDPPSGYLRFVKESIADIGPGNVAFTPNVFHVVTGTWNDATNSYAFTIDGAAAGSGTSTETLTAFTSTTIGLNRAGAEGMIGDIAEVLSWERVLSAGELATVAAALQAKYAI